MVLKPGPRSLTRCWRCSTATTAAALLLLLVSTAAATATVSGDEHIGEADTVTLTTTTTKTATTTTHEPVTVEEGVTVTTSKTRISASPASPASVSRDDDNPQPRMEDGFIPWVLHYKAWHPRDAAAGQFPAATPPPLTDMAIALAIAVGLTLVRRLLDSLIYFPVALCVLPAKTVVSLRLTEKLPADARASIFYGRLAPQERARYAQQGRSREWAEIRDTYRAAGKGVRAYLKFSESAWRFTAYASLVAIGLVLLWDKPWVWDMHHNWIGYPNHTLSSDMRFYVLVELGLYFHLIFAQFLEQRKKDFVEMLVHHVATIVLIAGSYLTNFWRIATVIILVHDISDPFLEGAKLFNYAGSKMADVFFVCFATSFGFLRLYVFPMHVIWSTYYDTFEHFGYFAQGYILNVMLFVLQLLHAFWYYLVLRMVYKLVITGEITKDERSQTVRQKKSLYESAAHLVM